MHRKNVTFQLVNVLLREGIRVTKRERRPHTSKSLRIFSMLVLSCAPLVILSSKFLSQSSSWKRRRWNQKQSQCNLLKLLVDGVNRWHFGCLGVSRISQSIPGELRESKRSEWGPHREGLYSSVCDRECLYFCHFSISWADASLDIQLVSTSGEIDLFC